MREVWGHCKSQVWEYVGPERRLLEGESWQRRSRLFEWWILCGSSDSPRSREGVWGVEQLQWLMRLPLPSYSLCLLSSIFSNASQCSVGRGTQWEVCYSESLEWEILLWTHDLTTNMCTHMTRHKSTELLQCLPKVSFEQFRSSSSSVQVKDLITNYVLVLQIECNKLSCNA